MSVLIDWSEEATTQYWNLSPDQRKSADDAATAIMLSPRVGTVFKVVQREGKTVEVKAFYGLLVRLLFALATEGRYLVVQIEDVRATELPSITEYEEGEEMRRSRPTWRGGRRRRKNDE